MFLIVLGSFYKCVRIPLPYKYILYTQRKQRNGEQTMNIPGNKTNKSFQLFLYVRRENNNFSHYISDLYHCYFLFCSACNKIYIFLIYIVIMQRKTHYIYCYIYIRRSQHVLYIIMIDKTVLL